MSSLSVGSSVGSLPVYKTESEQDAKNLQAQIAECEADLEVVNAALGSKKKNSSIEAQIDGEVQPKFDKKWKINVVTVDAPFVVSMGVIGAGFTGAMAGGIAAIAVTPTALLGPVLIPAAVTAYGWGWVGGGISGFAAGSGLAAVISRQNTWTMLRHTQEYRELSAYRLNAVAFPIFKKYIEEENLPICSISGEIPAMPTQISCGHIFDFVSISDWFEQDVKNQESRKPKQEADQKQVRQNQDEPKANCPQCRKPFSKYGWKISQEKIRETYKECQKHLEKLRKKQKQQAIDKNELDDKQRQESAKVEIERKCSANPYFVNKAQQGVVSESNRLSINISGLDHTSDKLKASNKSLRRSAMDDEIDRLFAIKASPEQMKKSMRNLDDRYSIE